MRSFLLLIVGMVMVNSLQAQQAETDANWLSQTDTAYHFSFSYPENWTLKLPGTNTRFFVTSAKESDKDLFRENLNCMVKVIEQKGFTIKMAEDGIKASLSKMDDFELNRLDYITWNKSETLEMDYTCTKKAEDITYHIHILQRMAVVNGTLFTLTFTSEVQRYNRYLPAVKKMMNSLQVK